MIITRHMLAARGACDEGLALYDTLVSDGWDGHMGPLHCVWLSVAYPEYAGWIWAEIEDAYLSGADLSGADLSGANLEGANLEGAALGGWERGPDGIARRSAS